jgi:hypothetical protein
MEKEANIGGKKMRQIRNLLAAGLGVIAILAQTNMASAQSANGTNAPVTGQLAGLTQLAMDIHAEDELPAKLCGMLWPKSGSHKFSIKKFTTSTGDGQRLFCLRIDNQDVVLLRRVETKPSEDTKNREEFYYRTTAKGDLVLALTAAFEFTIDDVDNEIFKKVTYETYGEVSGDGKKPFAMTATIKADFEAEKKYWLKMQKKLAKKRPIQHAD